MCKEMYFVAFSVLCLDTYIYAFKVVLACAATYLENCASDLFELLHQVVSRIL